MRHRSGWLRSALASVALIFMAAAPGATARADDAPVNAVILNAQSVWHIFTVLRPPMIQYDAGPKALKAPYEWVDKETVAPAEGWNLVNFPDGSWLRGSALAAAHTPYAAEQDFRARFEVVDPDQAKDLKLSLTYHGGVIVYVNGQEVGRANLAKDAKSPNALAEAYPLAAFATANGVLDGGSKEAQQARDRKLELTIPAGDLHQGTNVLALEVIHSPYDKFVADYWKHQPRDTRELGEKNLPYDLNWYTCELMDVQLSGGGAGVRFSVAPSKQLQAWNSDLLTTDTAGDVADPCDPAGPIAIMGPRNGWSSGEIVLGSPKPIEDLKVTWTDLKQDLPGKAARVMKPAVIPAAAMRARYAVAYENQDRPETPLEALLEKPLDSFPVGPAGSAVVPVWLTVKIPQNAKPGKYTGAVTIACKDQKTLTVPVTLEVSEYAVPDTQDYRTWMELMESPDTLAAEYNVPMWSDKHWALIAQSMRYIGEIGSRTLQIPLIAETNSGNAQSMVRWIKHSDGSCGYDFSIFDKYMDYAEKYMGKPKIVAFVAWDIYLQTPDKAVTLSAEDEKKKDTDFFAMEKSWAAARWDLRGKGPAVTLVDPRTQKISTINLPRFEEPIAKTGWGPLFAELHHRMARRGLERTMLLGMASDACPDAKEMATLEQCSGNLPWILQTHGGSHVDLTGNAKPAYIAYVWDDEYPIDPDKGRDYGWKRPELITEFRRFGALNDWGLPAIKVFPEIEITGKQRGLGRIGADFWPVIKDKRGQRRGWVWDKYPQSKWHSCNLMSHMLDPGPDGPVASTRYEMLREGVQECEARIAIERVLTDAQGKSRMGPEFFNRAQQVLDGRIWQELKAFSGLELTGRVYTTYAAYKNIFYYNAGGEAGGQWYQGSSWQEEAQKLYDLAGEVNRKLDLR